MMPAYSWNGVCYPDEASALNAFALSVPSVSSGGINTFTAAPTANGSGLVSWSIINRPLSGSSATTRTGTTQMPACSAAQMDQWSPQSLVWIAVLFFAVVAGWHSGYKR